MAQKPAAEAAQHGLGRFASSGLTAWLGVLTVALLLYCLISAVNARATFNLQTSTLDYHPCLLWLPHSFDSRSTWVALWTYLGLACSFWSIRDWLIGKSAQELRAAYETRTRGSNIDNKRRHETFPVHLRQLLIVLTFNGGLIALESIVQRVANMPKLLFLVTPEIHQTAITQLGPYAYRANGAEYLNLLWPVCLGFWWTMLSGTAPAKLRYSTLICVGLMGVAAMMSASRGGAFVCTSLLIIGAFYLLSRVPLLPQHVKEAELIQRHAPVLLTFALLATALGWHELKPRTTGISESRERRQRIYEVGHRMIKDFGVFGSGPGTYESVSELYRPESPGFWPAQVHNDWLETRITFGSVGAVLIFSVLAAVGLSWLAASAPYELVFLSGLALAGCLAHACFDFPFQVHSILFLFMAICAMLSSVSSRT